MARRFGMTPVTSISSDEAFVFPSPTQKRTEPYMNTDNVSAATKMSSLQESSPVTEQAHSTSLTPYKNATLVDQFAPSVKSRGHRRSNTPYIDPPALQSIAGAPEVPALPTLSSTYRSNENASATQSVPSTNNIHSTPKRRSMMISKVMKFFHPQSKPTPAAPAAAAPLPAAPVAAAPLPAAPSVLRPRGSALPLGSNVSLVMAPASTDNQQSASPTRNKQNDSRSSLDMILANLEGNIKEAFTLAQTTLAAAEKEPDVMRKYHLWKQGDLMAVTARSAMEAQTAMEKAKKAAVDAELACTMVGVGLASMIELCQPRMNEVNTLDMEY